MSGKLGMNLKNMHSKRSWLFTLTIMYVLVILTLSGCESPEDNLERISEHGGTSHNAGQDCTQLGCHDDRSNIQFSYAGTVYKYDNVGNSVTNEPIANANIHFVQFDPTDGVVATALTNSVVLQVDTNGNFYTTKSLSLNFPTEVPCVVPPNTTDYYCMPRDPAIDFAGKNCSNKACHLNRRINSDDNYKCTTATDATNPCRPR